METRIVKVREYTVKAHKRTISLKTFRFVCKQCDKMSERKSFGGRPVFCESCAMPPRQHLDTKSKKKKKPRPKAYVGGSGNLSKENLAAS